MKKVEGHIDIPTYLKPDINRNGSLTEQSDGAFCQSIEYKEDAVRRITAEPRDEQEPVRCERECQKVQSRGDKSADTKGTERALMAQCEEIIQMLTILQPGRSSIDLSAIECVYRKAKTFVAEFSELAKERNDIELEGFVSKAVDHYLKAISYADSDSQSDVVDKKRKMASTGFAAIFEKIDWNSIEAKMIDFDKEANISENEEDWAYVKEHIFGDDDPTPIDLDGFEIVKEDDEGAHQLPIQVVQYLRTALVKESIQQLLISSCGRMVEVIANIKEAGIDEENNATIEALYEAAQEFATNYLELEQSHPEFVLSAVVSSCVAKYLVSQYPDGHMEVKFISVLSQLPFDSFQEHAVGLIAYNAMHPSIGDDSNFDCLLTHKNTTPDTLRSQMVDVNDSSDYEAIQKDVCDFMLFNKAKVLRYWLPALVVWHVRKTLLSPVPQNLNANLRALKNMDLIDLEQIYFALDHSDSGISKLYENPFTKDVADHIENFKWRVKEEILSHYLVNLKSNLTELLLDPDEDTYHKMAVKVQKFCLEFQSRTHNRKNLTSIQFDIKSEQDVSNIIRLVFLYVDIKDQEFGELLISFLQKLQSEPFERLSSATNVYVPISDRSPLLKRYELINRCIGDESDRRLINAARANKPRLFSPYVSWLTGKTSKNNPSPTAGK